jgi:hypothetical protein
VKRRWWRGKGWRKFAYSYHRNREQLPSEQMRVVERINFHIVTVPQLFPPKVTLRVNEKEITSTLTYHKNHIG